MSTVASFIAAISVLVASTGCMTSLALVTSPVTSLASSCEHLQDDANLMKNSDVASCCNLFLLPFMVPAGVLVATGRGFMKDDDFISTGSYTTPGTLRLSMVFQPWFGTNGHVDPDRMYYPVAHGGKTKEQPTPPSLPATTTDEPQRIGVKEDP